MTTPLGRLQDLDKRLQTMTDPANDLLTEEGSGQALSRYGSRFQRLYDRLKKKGKYDVSGMGTYDPTTNKYYAPIAPDEGYEQPKTPPTPAPPPAGTPNPNEGGAGEASGLGMEDLLNAIIKGLPAGLDLEKIGTESGARAMEVLYPLIKDAYNMKMQQGALDVGYDALGKIESDPTLQAVSGMVTDRLANPFTFDDETVSLMRSRNADLAANQEASLRERLGSMGMRGVSPDSPLYASLAQQAALSRDINLANMERDLDIQMAQQRSTDKDRAIGIGSGWGGAYQTMLQQAYGNLANLYSGGRLTSVANPFEGLTESLMLRNEMSDARPSGLERVSQDVGLVGGMLNTPADIARMLMSGGIA